MSYTVPKNNWGTGDLMTAAIFNAEVANNIIYLKAQHEVEHSPTSGRHRDILNLGDDADTTKEIVARIVAVDKPKIRYNIATSKWELSHDGSVFEQISTPSVGDITEVVAGDGLTGGGSSGSVTLNVVAGSGITVAADSVAHSDTSSQASVDNSGATVIQDVTLDGFGHVTGLASKTINAFAHIRNTGAVNQFSAGDQDGLQFGASGIVSVAFDGVNKRVTFSASLSAGSGISVAGSTISHADTSSQGSVNNPAGTFVEDIGLDGFGHVTSLVSTALAAGGGISVSGATISHADTSSQGNVNNSGLTFIQDVTLDTYGHVIGLASATVDVGIKPGRIKEVLSEISTAAGAWATHLDILGSGFLDFVAARNHLDGADFVAARITIDGTLSDELVIGAVGAFYIGPTVDPDARYFFDIVGHRFNTSLKIEFKNTDSATQDMAGRIRYRLDL